MRTRHRHERGSALVPYQPRWKSVVSAPLSCEAGSALVTVLVLIVLLTVIGTAMIEATLTEITIAFNQGDAAAAQYIGEAGIARSIYELGRNASWTGVTDTLADGQYQASVTSSGIIRYVESTGTRGGGRQVLRAAFKAIPKFTISTVASNTTATIGSTQSGLTVSNSFPANEAGAVHANNRLGAATAMTINTTGATITRALTANGTISGVTCSTWPYRCNESAGVLSFPRLDADSAAASSLRERAKNTTDPADSKNLYFRGGDATSRCNSGGAWTFGAAETQRCWDKYVHDRTRVIGSSISNAVFFVEFNPSETTRYTVPSPISFRAAQSSSGNGVTSLTIGKPTGVVDNDVMIAAIAVKAIPAVAFDVAGTGSGTGTTINITGPNVGGSNRLLIVGIVQGNTQNPVSSVTWDQGGTNQAMTLVAIKNQGGGNDVRTEMWRLVAPTTGARTLRIVFATSTTVVVSISNYTGVDQTTPLDTAATNGGQPGSTPTVTVTSAVNDLVVDIMGTKENLTNKTAGAGQTERAEAAAGDELVATSDEAGAASVGMSWSGSFEEWASIGVSLNPAPAASVTITPPAGWTLVRRIDNGADISLAVYRKVASAEGASYTWTFSASSNASGGIQAYSGVDTTTPIDVENGQTTASGTSHSTPDVTTTVADAMLVTSFAVSASTTFTPPAGQTERYDVASTGTTSEGDDQAQATAGATGTKTATSEIAGPGAAHILALRKAGPVTVDCVGYETAVETLCIRARAATDSNNTVVYADSVLQQVTGAIVTFRRDAGTTVVGDIAFENMALCTTDYTHRSLTGDPALVAAGKVIMISSGTSAGRAKTEVVGVVYTFAGADNADANGILQGSGSVGIDVQHGANSVNVTFSGILVSNGSISLQDTASNAGSVTVQYDSTVAENLPAAFYTATEIALIPVSWSSKD